MRGWQWEYRGSGVDPEVLGNRVQISALPPHLLEGFEGVLLVLDIPVPQMGQSSTPISHVLLFELS